MEVVQKYNSKKYIENLKQNELSYIRQHQLKKII